VNPPRFPGLAKLPRTPYLRHMFKAFEFCVPTQEDLMPERRELYRSPNGDSWFLGREPTNGHAFIMHQPNAPSGGPANPYRSGRISAQRKWPGTTSIVAFDRDTGGGASIRSGNLAGVPSLNEGRFLPEQYFALASGGPQMARPAFARTLRACAARFALRPSTAGLAVSLTITHALLAQALLIQACSS
jgi:hypothetical protein